MAQKQDIVHSPVDLEQLKETCQEIDSIELEVRHRQEAMEARKKLKKQSTIYDYFEPKSSQQLKETYEEYSQYFRSNLQGELLFDILKFNEKIHNPKRTIPYYQDTYKMKHGKGQLSNLRYGNGPDGVLFFKPAEKVAKIEELRKLKYIKGEKMLAKLKNIIEETKEEIMLESKEKELIGENDQEGSLCYETKYMGTDFVKKEEI